MALSGTLYFNKKNYALAKQGLEKVLSIDSNYKTVAYFDLGLVYRETDDYENAVKNFELFLQSNNKSKRLRAKAETYLENSRFAAEAIKNPVPFDPNPLAKTINTSAPEYLPSVTAEGNQLIFTTV